MAVLSVVAIAAIAVHQYSSLEAVAAQETRLRQAVQDHPLLSWTVGLVVYALVSLIPGTGGKALVWGWLFGFLPGLVIVNLGLTSAAIVSFLVVRHFFQAAVHRRFGRLSRRIDQTLDREGGLYLLTLRLLHVPYTITNYAAGATTVRLRTFWWTTQLGMLPGNVVFVLSGSQIPSLKQLLQEGVWRLIDWPLLLALSLATLAPIAIRRLVQRWRGSPDV